MGFLKFNIHQTLVTTLEELGYDEPTPVQNKVIPKILDGLDLRVSAPTGTGKTAAFLLPIITKLLKKPQREARVLILVPTRELAIQVASQAEKYSKKLKRTKTVCIYGGVPYHIQNRKLSKPHDIIVATPGRLIDYIKRKKISLANIEMFILDEADRMLDMGFSEPVQEISKKIIKKHQTLLFSATLKGNVMSLSKKLLTNPLEININTKIDQKENIDERLHYVDDINHKQRILDRLLKNPKIKQAIVFTSTKRLADKLTKNLLKLDYPVAALHGDMNQRRRTSTIMKLRKGKLKILIATDVAARGIDIKTISHVINFDLPTNTEDYIHRIGRTARAGEKGTAFSFATTRERSTVLSIEKFTGKKMICEIIPGLEPKKRGFQKTFSKNRPNRNKRNKRKFYRKKF